MSDPIGIFDSGVGGLTVAREVFSHLPAEDVIYFGDVGRTPYGGRSQEIIQQFARQDIAFLTEHNVKAIVCACNTVSAVALAEIAAEIDLPIVGVIEPPARCAAGVTTGGRIGVIGTQATISSDAYARVLREINPQLKIFSKACPLFVPLAEEGYVDRPATRLIAEEYLAPMKEVAVDTLILGCTHYPLLEEVIREVMGPQVRLIGSGTEAARATTELLRDQQLSRDPGGKGQHRFYVSDVPEKFTQIATHFLGRKLDNVTRIDISRY